MEQATRTQIRLGSTIFVLSVDAHQLEVRQPGDLITAEIVSINKEED